MVLEATGGFETVAACALAGAQLPLAVVNPRQIRDFARAAIVACMRKLLTIANAIIRDQKPWQNA